MWRCTPGHERPYLPPQTQLASSQRLSSKTHRPPLVIALLASPQPPWCAAMTRQQQTLNRLIASNLKKNATHSNLSSYTLTQWGEFLLTLQAVSTTANSQSPSEWCTVRSVVVPVQGIPKPCQARNSDITPSRPIQTVLAPTAGSLRPIHYYNIEFIISRYLNRLHSIWILGSSCIIDHHDPWSTVSRSSKDWYDRGGR